MTRGDSQNFIRSETWAGKNAYGELVKRDDITKHKNDVFRLIATLTAGSASISESVASDLKEFFEHEEINNIKSDVLRSLLGVPTSLKDLLDIVAGYYRLQL